MEGGKMGGIMERVFPDDWDFGGAESNSAWDEAGGKTGPGGTENAGHPARRVHP